MAHDQITGMSICAPTTACPRRDASIARYLAIYNGGRPHSSLDGRTPDEAYFGAQAMATAA